MADDQLLATGIGDLSSLGYVQKRKGSASPFPFLLTGKVLDPGPRRHGAALSSTSQGLKKRHHGEELGSSTPPKVQIPHPDVYVRNYYFVSVPDLGRVSVYSSLAAPPPTLPPMSIPEHLRCQDADGYQECERPSSSCVRLQSPNSMTPAFPRA